MAAAAIPGLNFGPEVTYILAAILIITGLALAFYGHGLWTTVMSMIGALLGSAVGFLFGAALSSNIAVGLILALVGAVIGSILFTKLVKVALAFLVGLLAAAVVYGLLGGSARFTEGRLDSPLIGALLVLIVVFRISYYSLDHFADPLRDLSVRLSPPFRQRDPDVPIGTILEHNEIVGPHPIEVPREDVVVHIRSDLEMRP